MTTTDVQKVQKNLANLQDFNDYVYNSGNAYIANCYLLLGQKDDSDPGLLVGVSLLEGCMGAIFSCMGPVGAFSSCFLDSIISGWAQSSPPDLMQTCANMVMRFDKSHIQLDQDIAYYIQNTEANWDKTFTWNNTTITLGQLATIDFPMKGSTDFYDLARVALSGLDKSVWSNTLKIRCKNSGIQTNLNCGCVQVKGDTDIYEWNKEFIQNNPQYYNTWRWHSDSGMFDKNYWYVYPSCLTFMGATAEKRMLIPTGACAYLFIDSADGYVINPNGLFYRSYVFDMQGMGLYRCILRTAL